MKLSITFYHWVCDVLPLLILLKKNYIFLPCHILYNLVKYTFACCTYILFLLFKFSERTFKNLKLLKHCVNISIISLINVDTI